MCLGLAISTASQDPGCGSSTAWTASGRSSGSVGVPWLRGAGCGRLAALRFASKSHRHFQASAVSRSASQSVGRLEPCDGTRAAMLFRPAVAFCISRPHLPRGIKMESPNSASHFAACCLLSVVVSCCVLFASRCRCLCAAVHAERREYPCCVPHVGCFEAHVERRRRKLRCGGSGAFAAQWLAPAFDFCFEPPSQVKQGQNRNTGETPMFARKVRNVRSPSR